MFVVAYQTAVEHQDPVRLLHDPPLGLRDEPLVVRVALDDLDVDAHVRAVLDDLLLEALVDQGLLHRVALLGDPVQQGDAGGVVVRGGGQHDDRDDQAQHVHGQASLAARHLLRGIPARRRGGHPGGRVDALGVQHHQARVG